MSLKNWLNEQGFPNGFECVGEARLQQLWDDAQEACAKNVRAVILRETKNFTGDHRESVCRELSRIADAMGIEISIDDLRGK